jgi:hypothetical protein
MPRLPERLLAFQVYSWFTLVADCGLTAQGKKQNNTTPCMASCIETLAWTDFMLGAGSE